MDRNTLLDLSGKVAVVTGSTKGIGKGIALAFAKVGASLVITSRHQNECEQVAESIKKMGNRVLPVEIDVTNKNSLESMLEKALSYFGTIDVLVNNAGTALTKKAEDITEDDWDRVIDTNLKGVFLCSQIIGRHMISKKSGKIINIASVLGLVGERQVLPYCAAKGGVIQSTRALALEWARYNIQVNALCPGYLRTPMNEAEFAEEKVYRHIVSKIPLRRLGKPEDLEGAVLFLASRASDYMTGQMLVIDGGWTAE